MVDQDHLESEIKAIHQLENSGKGDKKHRVIRKVNLIRTWAKLSNIDPKLQHEDLEKYFSDASSFLETHEVSPKTKNQKLWREWKYAINMAHSKPNRIKSKRSTPTSTSGTYSSSEDFTGVRSVDCSCSVSLSNSLEQSRELDSPINTSSLGLDKERDSGFAHLRKKRSKQARSFHMIEDKENLPQGNTIEPEPIELPEKAPKLQKVQFETPSSLRPSDRTTEEISVDQTTELVKPKQFLSPFEPQNEDNKTITDLTAVATQEPCAHGHFSFTPKNPFLAIEAGDFLRPRQSAEPLIFGKSRKTLKYRSSADQVLSQRDGSLELFNPNQSQELFKPSRFLEAFKPTESQDSPKLTQSTESLKPNEIIGLLKPKQYIEPYHPIESIESLNLFRFDPMESVESFKPASTPLTNLQNPREELLLPTKDFSAAPPHTPDFSSLREPSFDSALRQSVDANCQQVQILEGEVKSVHQRLNQLMLLLVLCLLAVVLLGMGSRVGIDTVISSGRGRLDPEEVPHVSVKESSVEQAIRQRKKESVGESVTYTTTNSVENPSQELTLDSNESTTFKNDDDDEQEEGEEEIIIDLTAANLEKALVPYYPPQPPSPETSFLSSQRSFYVRPRHLSLENEEVRRYLTVVGALQQSPVIRVFTTVPAGGASVPSLYRERQMRLVIRRRDPNRFVEAVKRLCALASGRVRRWFERFLNTAFMRVLRSESLLSAAIIGVGYLKRRILDTTVRG